MLLGGRQLDGSVPALYALERIMKSPKVRAAQQSGKLTVLYDSGIRTGPDIFKALALGAQAVLCEVSFSKRLVYPADVSPFDVRI